MVPEDACRRADGAELVAGRNIVVMELAVRLQLQGFEACDAFLESDPYAVVHHGPEALQQNQNGFGRGVVLLDGFYGSHDEIGVVRS